MVTREEVTEALDDYVDQVGDDAKLDSEWLTEMLLGTYVDWDSTNVTAHVNFWLAQRKKPRLVE